jgi:nitrogen fixation protein NifU and related proteins
MNADRGDERGRQPANRDRAEDDLYREVILDHFRQPRNHCRLTDPDVNVEGVNPLCGDQLRLTLKLSDGRIQDVRMEGKGCSISQASASMMTEAVQGKDFAETQGLVKAFKHLMLENGTAEELPEEMEELAALEGVKKYPVRIKCALLSWNTLLEGLKLFSEKKTKVAAQHQEE